MLFPTMLVGSYAQPEWLIDRKKLAGRFPPRVRKKELWRVPEPWLAEAQNDATVLAIREQEEAGLDIITDGEIRRESYSNRFATSLAGVDIDHPGTPLDRPAQIYRRGAGIGEPLEPFFSLPRTEGDNRAIRTSHTQRRSATHCKPADCVD